MDQHSDPQYKLDDGSALRIWKDTAQNNFLSEKHGRPIFDEVTYVEVISPGSGNSTPLFEVVRVLAAEANVREPMRGTKYPEYRKYIEDFEQQEQHDASLSGTPLSEWREISRTLAATLKAQKIFTVDALANLPDSNLHVVGPDGRTWREKAIAYINNAKNAAYSTELAAQLDAARRTNDDLQRQLKELAAQVQILQEANDDAKTPQPTEYVPPTGPTPDPPRIPPPIDQAALQPII